MIGRVSMNFHSIHVDFSGIDFPVLSELALSLQTMLELYPDMEASIVAIGNSAFLLRYFSRMQEGKKSTWRKIKEIQESIQSSRTDMKNPMTIYHWREGKKVKHCCCLGACLSSCTKEELVSLIAQIRKHNPVLETDTVSSIFYHEFAHMLDATFDISRDSEIFRILRQIGHDSEEIYYVGRELFTDSFAEYYASEHPSQESTDLVSYVNRKYLENRSKEKQSGKRLIKTIQPK